MEYTQKLMDPRLSNGLNEGQICAHDPDRVMDTCKVSMTTDEYLITWATISMLSNY